jgi:Fe-S cluster biogenesis protein NfuA
MKKTMSKTKKLEISVENKIETILKKIRPYIQMHGGDVQFVKIEGGIASLRVYGACVDCELADLTYNKMIGGILKEEIPEIKEIVLEK